MLKAGRQTRVLSGILAVAVLGIAGCLLFFFAEPSIPGDTDAPAPAAASAAPSRTGQVAVAESGSADSTGVSSTPETASRRYWSETPDREIIASGWKENLLPELGAFAEWTEKYLGASAEGRAGLIEEGVALAVARRTVLGELIEQDPRRALAAAVPMAVRDQLPPEILELLEDRVSGYGNLFRISTFEAAPGMKPSFDYAGIGDEFYYAYRYGRRASLFELKNASLHGIALDMRLAVADSPVYVTETGQSIEGQPLNQLCLVSGEAVVTRAEGTVSERADAPIQVGTDLLGLCAPEHVENIESVLLQLEANGESAVVDGRLDLETLAERLRDPMPLLPMAYGGAPGTGWPGQPSTNLTYGHKRALIYRVQMQNWTPFPPTYTEAYCTNTLVGDQCTICYGGQLSKTVSNQVYEFSWGKTLLTEAVATPVLLLPRTRDQYTNNYFGPVLQDSMAAAYAAGFDTNVDFHVIVHSGLDAPHLNACAWGGGGTVWVNECWSVGVLVHEIGHVFGLPHANGWDITDGDVWSPTRTHVEYDDLTDPMGQGNGSQRNHYNSFFKYFLRWYPASLVLNVTNSGTYRLYQFDHLDAPLTNPMALLIRHNDVSSYWVAFRGNTTSGNFANAAQLLEVRNNQNDTHLLDFNSPDANNSNGGLTVNQSYYDSTANITIRTVAIGGTSPMRWLDFSVVIGEPPQLRAHYLLEDNLQDSSGHGHHGAGFGGAGFTTGRVHARALELDGVDGFVEIPRSISNDFTIAFWVRTTASGTAGSWRSGLGLVDGSVAAGQNDFGVALAGGRAVFGIGNPDVMLTSVKFVNDGSWHHVAATRNSAGGELKLYVDGALEGSATGPTAVRNASTVLRLGSLLTGAGFLEGSLDDVRLYNYSLNAADIAALASLPSAPHVAGALYVDLHATTATVSGSTWINQGSLGNFARVGLSTFTESVGGTGIPGVSFSGADAYQGPNAVPDIEGSSDRTIEVWAYNPSLASEETMVSLGHRGTTRRNLGFNFGSHPSFGAVTHYNDDVGWGTPPASNAWQHLVYTYSGNTASVYVNGVLRSTETLGGALNTFANEPINIACQRNTANGTRSFHYSGFLNSVRIHGGVLSPAQILANWHYGTWVPSAPPGAPSALAADARDGQIRLSWDPAPGGATRYIVRRSTQSGGPYSIVAPSVAAQTFSDTNVVNGQLYHYVVAAANFFGESADSAEASVTAIATPRPSIAGVLYVDLRANESSAGSVTWLNHGALGDFTRVGLPTLVANVAGTGRPGVSFNGSSTAYSGPMTVPDIEGSSDRSIEVWVFNPSLASEETTVSWGRRGTTRRNIAFNFGSNATWGAATHWADDVGWGTAPTANAWHHLVYTCSNNVVRVYVDGVQRNMKTLSGNLDTFPNEPINIGCQREAGGSRSLWFSGYINAVRIHGGVLTPQQIQFNYQFGPWLPNSAPVLAPVPDQIVVAGATLAVTNSATDLNASQQTLTYSLLAAPEGASLGPASGIFQWRPGMTHANTTNPVILMVADNGFPILSATQTFSIAVLAPMTPALGTPVWDNGVFGFAIAGDPGLDYTILGSSNLLDWVPVFTTNALSMPIWFADPEATNHAHRFYRVLLGP